MLKFIEENRCHKSCFCVILASPVTCTFSLQRFPDRPTKAHVFIFFSLFLKLVKGTPPYSQRSTINSVRKSGPVTLTQRAADNKGICIRFRTQVGRSTHVFHFQIRILPLRINVSISTLSLWT